MIDLEFRQVSKRYRVRADDPTTGGKGNPYLRKLRRLRHRSEDFWPVRDVSFQVERGESLGIIGHNGAGKSTILKLLASITAPSSGEIKINGRLSALIEVGSGFHPELTGRENVFLSGSILGMRRREIAAKLDSIVEFAGVRQFIDTPVKRYSSGMYVRLGFAIAAHLDPDILLLDEVLAVGDAAFQSKCMQRIEELERAGTTIVFISHDLHSVKRICSRVLLMERGRVVANGPPGEVIKVYAQTPRGGAAQLGDGLCFRNSAPDHDLPFEVESVEMLDRNGRRKYELRTGDYVRFRVVWRAAKYVEHGGVEIGISNLDGVPLIRYSNQPVSGFDLTFKPGLNEVDLEFQQFPLTAGDYQLSVGLSMPMVAWLHRIDQLATFSVREGKVFQGDYVLTSDYSVMAVPHRWMAPQSGVRHHEVEKACSSVSEVQ